jgi:hypothetical protein
MDDIFLDINILSQPDNRPLRSPANGPGDMRLGNGSSSSRDDKGCEGFQGGIHFIDPFFQETYLFLPNHWDAWGTVITIGCQDGCGIHLDVKNG